MSTTTTTPEKLRPLAWLSQWLNDGQRTGFKPGDKIQISNSRGIVLDSEVIGPAEKRSEPLVLVGETTYVVRKQRPTSYPKASFKPKPRRDARGRFTR